MNAKSTVRPAPAAILILLPVFFVAATAASAQNTGAAGDTAALNSPVISGNLSGAPDVPSPGAGTSADDMAQNSLNWGSYFQTLGGSIKSGLFDAGANKLTLLVDGQEVIQSVVADVNNARKFIHIEVFAWQADEVGAQFRDLLAAKVKAGVSVRVILDKVGSNLLKPNSPEHKFVVSMIKDGIKVKVRPFQVLHLDHRKVMAMDDGNGGLVAYTGGMNIGNDYQRNWHDQQTRVEGPAIGYLHQSFLDDWKKVAGEALSGFPPVPSGNGAAHTYVITHIGGDTDQNIKRAYLLAINTARQLIRIEDPYFTDKNVIGALIKAAQRPGMKVQLIVPLKDDEKFTLRAFRAHYPDMLKAGIEIYEYQPRMEHLKVSVMDHLWATVGSSNLDDESMKFNNEMNLLVMDRVFAASIDQRIFEVDIPQSKRITKYKPSIGDIIDEHMPFKPEPSALPSDALPEN